MKVGHTKRNSLENDNYRPLKSDRPSTRPFLVTTEGTEINPVFEHNSTYVCQALINQFPNRQKQKNRSSHGKSHSQNRSTGKVSVYIRTDDSGPNDASDDLILKISRLKIELKNHKEKEKVYIAKINDLEKDKDILLHTLDKFKKKFSETAKENKEDKRRLNNIMESIKATFTDFNRPKTDRDTLSGYSGSLSSRVTAESNSGYNGLMYKVDLAETVNNLALKLQEVEAYANLLLEENNQMRKDSENFKKRSENLKTSTENNKAQLKHQEDTINELVTQIRLNSVDCEYLKDYVKHLIEFTNSKDKGESIVIKKSMKPVMSTYQKISLNPIPSYVKALSMTMAGEDV